jgi:small subunit ribosomal protein S8
LACAESVSESWQTKAKFQVFEKQVGSMMTDPISDMLTRIRNAGMVKKTTVDIPMSKVKFALAKIFEKEGYVGVVELVEEAKRSLIRVVLNYEDGRNKISSIKRVSTPGRRVYVKTDSLPRVQSGLGMAVISTPNGLMTNREARKRRLGGEVICEIF